MKIFGDALKNEVFLFGMNVGFGTFCHQIIGEFKGWTYCRDTFGLKALMGSRLWCGKREHGALCLFDEVGESNGSESIHKATVVGCAGD